MNKSLELNFWPILYNSIVFICLKTGSIYKIKQITYRWAKKLSSKLLFTSSKNTDGFY